MIPPPNDTPYRIRFSVGGEPDAEGGWAFPSIEEARNMAHFTLRQALLGHGEPTGVAQIFDFEGRRLGYMSAILYNDTEHWAWKNEADIPHDRKAH
jgi:hypothetical protein